MRFLTATTLINYLNTKDIDKIMSHADNSLLELKSDIVRMMLLDKYGGMWMDANSVFTRDLSWVDQLHK